MFRRARGARIFEAGPTARVLRDPAEVAVQEFVRTGRAGREPAHASSRLTMRRTNWRRPHPRPPSVSACCSACISLSAARHEPIPRGPGDLQQRGRASLETLARRRKTEVRGVKCRAFRFGEPSYIGQGGQRVTRTRVRASTPRVTRSHPGACRACRCHLLHDGPAMSGTRAALSRGYLEAPATRSGRQRRRLPHLGARRLSSGRHPHSGPCPLAPRKPVSLSAGGIANR